VIEPNDNELPGQTNAASGANQKHPREPVLSGHGASIDTTTPAGKLVFGIFAGLADNVERAIMQSHGTEVVMCARASHYAVPIIYHSAVGDGGFTHQRGGLERCDSRQR